ncbi:MAG: serine protein kinase RIO [Candidatus Thermoplasmatota archaeon]
MSSDKFLDRKKLKKLDAEIQKTLQREGLDRKTSAEVFDKSTLFAIEKLMDDKIISAFDFPISTGKEGNVFRAINPEKQFLAVKIYRISTSTFKHITRYIVGDPRFKSIHKNKRDIIYEWTKKEYKNLKRLKEINVKSPTPFETNKNVLVMDYLGSKEYPAPRLIDITPEKPKEIFNQIIKDISKMYKKANLIHCDMSPFNILIHKNTPYIIDLGQGVLKDHPNSKEFLRRDIKNIVKYFKKFKIKADEKNIYNNIIS